MTCRRRAHSSAVAAGGAAEDSGKILQKIHGGRVWRGPYKTLRTRRIGAAEDYDWVRLRRSLPARGRLFEDGDRSILDAEIAAGDQVLEQAADHVARSADTLGDVLLGEPLRND